jgi:hypothetical protein
MSIVAPLGSLPGWEAVDVSKVTFLLFTVFSSLRIVSYLPQIRRVALDANGATAISYSTWGLWTSANLATALYAAVNLHDLFLCAVSAVYATCCISVVLLTMLKRRRLGPRSRGSRGSAASAIDPERQALVEDLRKTVQTAAGALAANGRPHHAFEQDLATLARGIVRHDLARGIASIESARKSQGDLRHPASDVVENREGPMTLRDS